MPLTASSGYLFGLIPGAGVVLISATIAACIRYGSVWLYSMCEKSTCMYYISVYYTYRSDLRALNNICTLPLCMCTNYTYHYTRCMTMLTYIHILNYIHYNSYMLYII